MVRHGHVVVGSYSSVSPLQRLRRRSRAVQVKVVAFGHEVDAFESCDPQVLRSALRTVYRHLSKGSETVHLSGIEEEWLPMGIDRVRREVKLSNVADALFFLAA